MRRSAPTSRYSTRTSAACAVCRTKKRKCSGDRPICAECRSLNLACKWPKQLKRGPAKHYIRSLEERLKLTEKLFRNLLKFVSNDQLSCAVQANGSLPSSDNLPTVESGEKTDPECWQLYPLTSAENIRAWQNDSRTFGSGSSLPTFGSDHDTEPQMQQQQQQPQPVQREDPVYLNSTVGFAGSRGKLPAGTDTRMAPSPWSRVTDHLSSQSQQFNISATSSIEAVQEPSSTSPTSHLSLGNATSTATNNTDAGISGLQQHKDQIEQNHPVSSSFVPLSFQKQFLW